MLLLKNIYWIYISSSAIISAKPLDDLRYKGFSCNLKSFTSPYASYVYLGWATVTTIHYKKKGLLRRSKIAAKAQKSTAKSPFDL